MVVAATALAVTAGVYALVANRADKQAAPPSTTTVSSTSVSSTSTSTTSTSTTTTSPPTTVAPSTTAISPRTTTTVATSPSPAVAIRRGNPSRAVVALTFDAGSDPGYAAPILDVLQANGIHASFGITGKWAQANPNLVARMAAEGHQLVNHSYDHPSFTGGYGGPVLTQAQRLDQLARAEAAISAAAGVSAKPWFRPPYGAEDASVRSDIARAGYRYELMWTVDSWGWKGVPVDEVVRRCVDGAVPGAIFLLHVGGASTDYGALQQVIDGLRQKGYGFATAAELIA